MPKTKIRTEEPVVKNRPIKKFRSGSIEGAIWENKREIDEGEVEFKTVSISRSWKKKNEDTWRHDVISLRKSDISRLIVVLNELQRELLLSEETLGGDN